jgi:hypothetical protein
MLLGARTTAWLKGIGLTSDTTKTLSVEKLPKRNRVLWAYSYMHLGEMTYFLLQNKLSKTLSIKSRYGSNLANNLSVNSNTKQPSKGKR